MAATQVAKDAEYVYNHCTKALARDVRDARHSYFATDGDSPRGSISEPWRFPIVDAHDGPEADAYEWNDVTFVYAEGITEPAAPADVALLTTAHALHEAIPMPRVEDSAYRACTLKVRKGERHRYRFIVDGAPRLDPINPQTETLHTGDAWSSFFTWTYNQPISFERWEIVLLDRLTRHILPFNSPEAQNFLRRGANEGSVGHLYRLDVSLGVANYIDKIVAREERHHRYAYKTCLEMIERILRRRYPAKDPAFIEESAFTTLYDQLAVGAPALFADGWDGARYGSPQHFLWLLRRHAWTGAFAHPKWGGNPGGLAWSYLAERFRADGGATAFAWWQAVEPPLGTSPEYRG
jgi:hypothetical protein